MGHIPHLMYISPAVGANAAAEAQLRNYAITNYGDSALNSNCANYGDSALYLEWRRYAAHLVRTEELSALSPQFTAIPPTATPDCPRCSRRWRRAPSCST